MTPKTYLQKFAANVVKRSGICKATVEAVLPHVFDEIRYQMTEGTLCVPIESFGTFAVIAIPERRRLYTYKGANEIHTLPATLRLKFNPTNNFKQEIANQQFNPTRQSFTRHPDDRPVRKRRNMRYNKRNTIYIGNAIDPLTASHRVVDAYEHIDLGQQRKELHKKYVEQKFRWIQQQKEKEKENE